MADVTIYTRQFCGFCIAAKRLFEGKAIAFTERDATFSRAVRREMSERSGGRATFPQIFIGGTHVGGCRELMALEADGGLDALVRGTAKAPAS